MSDVAGHESMAPCVCCGSSAARRLFLGSGFDDARERFALVECLGCGVVRTHPVPGPAELARYYDRAYYGSPAAKFNAAAEGFVRAEHAARARRLVRMLESGRGGSMAGGPGAAPKVLDVGCGRGFFLHALRRLGCECHGSERPGFVFETAEPGIHFHSGELEDLGVATGSFDAVTIWHVLEHTGDPAGTTREASRILRKGGVMAIAVPNFGSLQRRLFGGRWFHLDLPRHLFHFRRRSLLDLLEQSGLAPLSVGTFSAEQNVFGFVQSALNRVLPESQHNRLYASLKAGSNASPAGQVLLAGMALPFSLIEAGVSQALGCGATLVVHARKR